MMQNLEGKRAIVTGGSRGIGRAIALDLAAAGAWVALTCRDRGDLAAQVVAEIEDMGGQARALLADVTDFAAAQSVVARVIEAWGRLDILVNNASTMQNAAIWDMTEVQWDAVLEVGLKGAFNYMRAVAPIFATQRSGKIVSVASIHGLRGREAGPNYSAAKAGLIGLSKSVARDLGPSGINVNVVAPGIVETDMVRALPAETQTLYRQQIILGRMGQPEDVAHLVTFLCSDLARHITGEVIKVDGGQYI